MLKYAMITFSLATLNKGTDLCELREWLEHNLRDDWSFVRTQWRFKSFEEYRLYFRDAEHKRDTFVLEVETKADAAMIMLRWGWEAL